MSHGERGPSILRTHPLPVVETHRAAEMPQKIVYDRSHREEGPASPWIPFLKERKPGESFVVDNHTTQYVQFKARQLDIDIVARTAHTRWKTRIWIYGIPGDRNPIIKRFVTQKKVTREEIIHPRTEEDST